MMIRPSAPIGQISQRRPGTALYSEHDHEGDKSGEDSECAEYDEVSKCTEKRDLARA
jgi:hypothetical protein